jgi:hypothetical protein
MPPFSRLAAFTGLALASAVWAGDLPTAPLPDDGKSPAAIAEIAVRRIDPPEKDFYTKLLDYHGLPIKGASGVSDAVFHEAWRRVDNLLHKNPVTRFDPSDHAGKHFAVHCGLGE